MLLLPLTPSGLVNHSEVFFSSELFPSELVTVFLNLIAWLTQPQQSQIRKRLSDRVRFIWCRYCRWACDAMLADGIGGVRKVRYFSLLSGVNRRRVGCVIAGSVILSVWVVFDDACIVM